MHRLLTKRDKNVSHRRSKSSEAVNKVTTPKHPLQDSTSSSDAGLSSFRSSSLSSISSICSAFKKRGKSPAHNKTSACTLSPTVADSMFGFILQPRPLSSNGILSLLTPKDKKREGEKKRDAEYTRKIEALKQRVQDEKMAGIEDAQIEYALDTKYARGDLEKAFEILVLFQESVDGIVKPYDPNIHMRGAENREAVTCYLDSLLFAMFARLGSFEPILYTRFEDEPRRRLSTLIRLWVNMLRTGKLIQTDITRNLQEALAACGWEEAAELAQQDTSEAFGFITEQLKLPLLTMEMDIFHEGKGDATDDHKFINERLLEVAIPGEPHEGRVIRLEDCLEEYFNARVEVVRRLDRRNTLQLVTTQTYIPSGLPTVEEKEMGIDHVEYVDSPTETPEISSMAEILEPLTHTESIDGDGSRSMTPVQVTSSPGSGTSTIRPRAASIIRRVLVSDEAGETSTGGDAASTHSSTRKASLRKEVLMPAWQFFRIIPWYTAQVPTNDAQVAAHFNSTRPVLGICLKRYAMSPEGRPIRLNSKIDIPLQIALPHFIQDDKAAPDGPLFGNFNLVLQSVVCHRGTSVHAGHYISLIRGTSKADDVPIGKRSQSTDSELPGYSEDRWIKFDDLAPERVVYVDIEKAMAQEMPYLLFYQVQPIYPDPPPDDPDNRPPSYQDSGVSMNLQEATPITQSIADPFPVSSRSSYFESTASSFEDPSKARNSFSDDVDRPRKSMNTEESRRGSLANTDTSTSSIPSVPVTPGEEASQSRISRAASRFGRRDKSKSRPNSHVDESRISATFSRIALMGRGASKETFSRGQESSPLDVVVNAVNLDGTADGDGKEGEGMAKKVTTPPTPLGSSQTEPLKPTEPLIPSSRHSLDILRGKKDKEKDKGKGKNDSKAEGGTFSNNNYSTSEHGHSPTAKVKGKEKDPTRLEEKRECRVM